MDFRAQIVSWEEIENWCSAIRDKVIENFTPDVIVGLSRGGLVPARILSDSLWIKDLLSIKTEHWGITATKSGEAVLNDPGKLNLKGKRVLVVDDITDTGQSMQLAYDFIKDQNPKELRTATMLHITRSEFVPDYYGEEISGEKWTWFIFPWNVYEDLDNLLSKSLESRLDLKGIENLLHEHYGLSISETHLQRILDDFVKSGKISHESNLFYRNEKR